jgi:hypothetical protein
MFLTEVSHNADFPCFQKNKETEMKTVGLMDIKMALSDGRFCDLFPELRHEIDKYLKEPKCGACAVPVVKEILNKYPERVSKYFPNRQVVRPTDEKDKLSENNFTVINCKITELEDRLRKLGVGRKQIVATRYENDVTVIVNELAFVH